MSIITSENVSKISAALIKAQKTIKVAVFDAQNPHFKSRYATLGSVVEACKEALNANDICFIQGAHSDAAFPGCVCVTTRLLHISGEYIEDTIVVPYGQQTAQAMGSSLTYGRRYGLASLLGIVSDEDDDAESAMPVQHQQTQKKTYPYQKPAQPAQPVSKAVEALRAKVKEVCSKEENKEQVEKAKKAMNISSMKELADFDEAKLQMFIDVCEQK